MKKTKDNASGTEPLEQPGDCNRKVDALVLRLNACEKEIKSLRAEMMAIKSDSIGGYICVSCGNACPTNYYVYTIESVKTGQVKNPCCGSCAEKSDPKCERVEGPFPQNDKMRRGEQKLN